MTDDDEFEVGGDRLLYLGGKATDLRVVSPKRCHRGVEPLCDATPERVEALVDAMRATMERHHPEAIAALTLVTERRAANLGATDIKIPPVFEVTEAMKRDRVAIYNMAMDFAPRKRRSPVEGVGASVYIAHEAGGDDPAQVARELTERAAAKARGIKELQRKLYRLYALLHHTSAMIGVESASFRVDGLYGREDHEAASSCIICFDSIVGASWRLDCGNRHGDEVVYCRECSDIVADEGVCPICRAPVLGVDSVGN